MEPFLYIILLILVALLFFGRTNQPTGNVIIFNNSKPSQEDGEIRVLTGYNGERLNHNEIEAFRDVMLTGRNSGVIPYDVEISKKEASEEQEGIIRKVSLSTYNARASVVDSEIKKALRVA